MGRRFKDAIIKGTRWNNALIDDEAAQELESLGIAYREWGMRLVQSIPGIDYNEIRRHILEQERAIYDLTPSQFETLVCKILEQSGCEVMRAKDATEDIGYDIIAKLPPSADGTRQTLVVECANYGTMREIGASRIRKLARHKARLSASGAMLCTNARWTSEAIRTAAATNVKIIDGKTLIDAIKFDRPINFFAKPLSSSNPAAS
ncbi:MAG: restriction endonuclease [Phycisphaerales bacterium]